MSYPEIINRQGNCVFLDKTVNHSRVRISPVIFGQANCHGIRKGNLSYCSGVGLKKLFVYRLSKSLIKITIVKAMKPIL